MFKNAINNETIINDKNSAKCKSVDVKSLTGQKRRRKPFFFPPPVVESKYWI